MRPVNGMDLFAEVGDSGPAVVCVHGLGGTTNFYQHQAQALAGTRRDQVGLAGSWTVAAARR